MTQPQSELLRIVEQYRIALARHDARALSRLTDAYQRIYARLKDKIDLLADAVGSGEATTGQLVRMARYRSLMRQVEDELRGYQSILGNEIANIGNDAITFAGRDTSRLLQMMAGEYGIQIDFHRLPVETIKTLLGFLSEDGPLYARLEELAATNAKKVADTILESVALGKNPRVLAGLIRDALGGGLTDALRMARTVQLWSYREATRANYLANSDVVEGWVWYANLPGEPCMACIAQHGSIHGLDETLNDHHNGRCAMIPIVAGLPSPVTQSGEAWFKGLPEASQKQLMGQTKWDAWKGGKFEFGRLAGSHDDKVYGRMTVEQSLSILLGET